MWNLSGYNFENKWKHRSLQPGQVISKVPNTVFACRTRERGVRGEQEDKFIPPADSVVEAIISIRFQIGLKLSLGFLMMQNLSE